jgi:hypothetical protein
MMTEPVAQRTIAGGLTRSRYAEARLTDSFSQYVILDAGLSPGMQTHW